MCFLTSTYPSTHGYYGLYGAEPQSHTSTLFGHFRNHGYRTGALGKLHTPRYLIEKDCQFVYDEFIEHPKYLEAVGLYEQNDNRAFNGNRDGECSNIPYEHSVESVLAKQAIRFIRNQGEPKDRGDAKSPWIGWISFSRPHQPYTPSKEFYDLYNEADLHLPPLNEHGYAEGYSESRVRKELRAYLALCSQVDHAIGTILEELKESGLDENTIVVYTSDHGDYAGEHGAMEKLRGISYRAITRIPMIVHIPGMLREGQSSDALVESIDLFPTLCEFADIPFLKTMQGMSFAEIIYGKRNDFRPNVLTENPYRKALATKEWRYIANLEGEKDELYNIVEDPYELQNRIDDPDCAILASEMLRTLLRRVVKARKPITTINGQWHNHRYDEDGRIDLTTNVKMNSYW
jgi:choline-sulfatase/uncharacterized sulfatase